MRYIKKFNEGFSEFEMNSPCKKISRDEFNQGMHNEYDIIDESEITKLKNLISDKISKTSFTIHKYETLNISKHKNKIVSVIFTFSFKGSNENDYVDIRKYEDDWWLIEMRNGNAYLPPSMQSDYTYWLIDSWDGMEEWANQLEVLLRDPPKHLSQYPR